MVTTPAIYTVIPDISFKGSLRSMPKKLLSTADGKRKVGAAAAATQAPAKKT
jgi:hypothetical protein